MEDLPFFDARGERARLFPVLSEKSKEGRTFSAFLAVFGQVRELANELLRDIGQPIGVRAKIETYTEVSFPNSSQPKLRPDGLIVVHTGKRMWSALVEAKVGNEDLQCEQVESYLALAREVGVDAVITVSNQFTSTRDTCPVTVNGRLLRSVALFHFSWFSILTSLSMLNSNDLIEDTDHTFLIGELERFLIHPSAGLKRFTQMSLGWTAINDKVRSDLTITKTSEEARDVIESWQAELRDLCLYLSRKTGELVTQKIPKKIMNDQGALFDRHMQSLTEQQKLLASLDIPNTAAPLVIEADLSTRTIRFSVELAAPKDKKQQASRLNWLIWQLPDYEEVGTKVRTLWPGRAEAIETTVSEASLDAKLHSHPDRSMLPHKFMLIDQITDGRKFVGRSTFISVLESGALDFYDNILSNLKAWAPPAPKIRKAVEETDDDTED